MSRAARLTAAALALAAGPVLAQTPAPATPAAAAPAAAAPTRAVDAENSLLIQTTKGPIVVEMYPAVAPTHVERLKTLARRGFYNNIVFHRVIDGFMAQTGDPTGTGEGDSDLPNIAGEFTFRRGADMPFVSVAKPAGSEVGLIGALPVETQPSDLMALTADGKVTAWGRYCPGVLGMARNADPDSANAQFFLMRAPYPSLEKRYTAFGRVVSGLNVVQSLKVGEPPVDPDRMIGVRVLADVPAAERPPVAVLDTRSPAFTARVQAARTAKGADFSICDVETSAGA